ncbi:sigma-70 family RNA polymerase sigma factor [Streptomyces mirabilis]|uniref:Sigma-70 family RNA polymerase sigma factor n=1 Tax=Streptomyces mirabilis TaxID=68239 RepID=A0ABU3V594_9ACTN|nr:sigma-70 family RNA polymerase sigma factor [Streptomyces mirabilis]MCX5355703.1 sigma-70 family RNA polymerase sigma factor [Streptomyces mirabilis]MDU9001346.1 sigma-70 family RNA polymerase sigma factor [Streptomyces mirabilis]
MAQHRSSLVAYAEHMLLDRHLAEDVVQEAFIRAWHHAEKLRTGEGSVRNWLLKVTRNLVIDRARSAAVRYESVMEELRDLPEPDHSDEVLASQEALALLRGLSSEHREVLVHVCLYGFTVRETARRLGIPPGTVKSRQHYALNILRRRVGLLPARVPAEAAAG